MARKAFREVRMVYNPKRRKKQDNRKKVLQNNFKNLKGGQRRQNGKFTAQRR
ncbi:MAG: hypothetical protein NTX00_05480 [Candidatus Parcubacteria bacterium]|nr:hypothetical protein [Candidatus Parcubacteria bacterium]